MPLPATTEVPLDEADARRVLLLQCVESAPESPLWTAEDRRWATRAATQGLGDDGARGRWLAERARLAQQRLAPRDAALRHALEHPLWRPGWAAVALGAGALAGLLSDALLAGPYFKLLSPPFFGLLAWNLALYAALAGRRLRGVVVPGPLQRGVAHWLDRWVRGAARSHALGDFAARWAAASQPLTAARTAWLMHLAGAGLALGLIVGMYARALVFDYRAGWATTLLDAGTVHAVLAVVFAPAQALSGIAVPDAAGIAALRVVPGAVASVSAAPWLHLMAITLALFVVLPRLGLAALARWRAAGLARAFPVSLRGAYFDRLRPSAGRSGVVLRVVPHGHAPTAQTAERLERWLREGAGAALAIAEPVPYGDEDAAGAHAPPAEPTAVLFDLAATPEGEVHGRLLRALPGQPLLLLDETEFVRRFGTSGRLAQRRAAWAALARSLDLPMVTVDLEHPDAASADALRAALER